jgi:hypothetical protein
MTHFLKRTLLMLVPATLTPLVLCVPAGAAGNPQHDYSVGGGQIATFGSANNLCFPSALSFGASAHVDNNTLTTGIGGMVSASCVGGGGHIVSKVDCLAVSGNVAFVTSVVEHSTGVFAVLPPGTEIANTIYDSGVPGGMGDVVGSNITNAPCNFNAPLDSPIAHGDLHVYDAP